MTAKKLALTLPSGLFIVGVKYNEKNPICKLHVTNFENSTKILFDLDTKSVVGECEFDISKEDLAKISSSIEELMKQK